MKLTTSSEDRCSPPQTLTFANLVVWKDQLMPIKPRASQLTDTRRSKEYAISRHQDPETRAEIRSRRAPTSSATSRMKSGGSETSGTHTFIELMRSAGCLATDRYQLMRLVASGAL